MDCRDLDRLMDAWLDRRAPESQAHELEAHLSSCDRCRREWASLVTLLNDPVPVEVPAGLRDRVVKALEQSVGLAGSQADGFTEPGSDGLRMRRWMSGISRWRRVGALAACVTFFLAGWLISGWWTGSHHQIVVINDPGSVSAPVTIVISPWMMSSLAQAAVMPMPGGPAIMLAQGVVPELMISPPQVDEPDIRVSRKRVALPSTRPADLFSSPEMQVVPLIPRYLGA